MIDQTFRNANIAFQKKDYGSSVELYKQCIANGPSLWIYYQNLAWAYEKIGDFRSAAFHSRVALSLSPKNYVLRRKLAEYEAKLNVDRTKSKGPLLSIIVPVYNTKKYLKKCIDSILGQSFANFELIVVNDGSTDGSWGVLKGYKDSRLVVLSNALPSGNPGTPRNQGIAVAKGHYIGFVDSDDWIDSDFYEKLMEKALVENCDIVFSGGFKNIVGSLAQERKYNNSIFNDTGSEYYKFHDSFMIWDKVFRADLIKSFDIKLGETKAAVDVPFIFKAYYYSHLVGSCGDLIGYNYRRETESSVTVNQRMGSDCRFELEAYKNIQEWADQCSVAPYYRNLINIKMVGSYLYSLKMIGDAHFNEFFQIVKDEFSKIDPDEIRIFATNVKKWGLYKEFCAVLESPSEVVYEKLKEHKLQIQKRGLKRKYARKFSIQGKRKGVMFFPAWVNDNPYQRLFYNALAQRFDLGIAGFAKEDLCKELLEVNRDEFDYIHMHWLHAFIDPKRSDGADRLVDILQYAKTLGYKLIYTAHNIISHESANQEVERAQRVKIMALMDWAIVHGDAAYARLKNELNPQYAKVAIMPHGSYEGWYRQDVTRSEARDYFGIGRDKFVFLFFGNIRGYKGLGPLLTEFGTISQISPEAVLLIAGRVSDAESLELLNRESAVNPNIVFRPGFIKDDDVQFYFRAADVCVLPYQRILTSGAAMLALTFKCPIIAPRKGVLPEVVSEDVGFLFNDYDEMNEAMRRCLRQDCHLFDQKRVARAFEDLLQKFGWGRVIERLGFFDD